MDDATWKRAQDGCPDARDEIIRRHSPLVGYVASRLRTSASIPAWVDTDDLISYGNIGLMDAMQRFEPERGLQFATYAVRRIKGAILDELRRMDWAPRQLRPDVRTLTVAHAEMSHDLGRTPTRDELAAQLNWEPRRVDSVAASIGDTKLLSLDAITGWADEAHEDDEIAPMGTPSQAAVGEEAMAEAEYTSRVSQAFDLMQPHERSLMALYYFEEMRFSDIAELLGVSESWVCMIYAQALSNMRSLATI